MESPESRQQESQEEVEKAAEKKVSDAVAKFAEESNGENSKTEEEKDREELKKEALGNLWKGIKHGAGLVATVTSVYLRLVGASFAIIHGLATGQPPSRWFKKNKDKK